MNTIHHKAHILQTFNHSLTDSLVAIAIIYSLPKTYSTLKTILLSTPKDKLSSNTIINHILVEEKSQKSQSSSQTTFVAHLGKEKGKVQDKGKGGQGKGADGKPKLGKCVYCKKKDHYKAECRKMKHNLKKKGEGRSEKKSAEALHVKVARAESDNDDEHIHLFMAQMLQEWKAEVAERWIVDSGASLFITSNCEWLANYCKLSKPKKVLMEDERYIYTVGVGQVKIMIHWKAIYLVQNVYYVSNLNGNLLSVFYLVNRKYYVYFLLWNTRPAVEINDPDGHIIAYGHEENSLFIFDGTTCLSEEYVNITILSDLKLVNDSVEEKMDEPP